MSGQHRAIESASTSTGIVIESPMSFTGSYKRTRNLFDDFMPERDGAMQGILYWSGVVALLFLWWLAILAEYVWIACMFFIPLAWVIPYRVMRQRQRKERAVRQTYFQSHLPQPPGPFEPLELPQRWQRGQGHGGYIA